MENFSKIVIIYNPNSTGNSPAMAKELAEQLRKKPKKVSVELLKTKRAGHAEELAYKAAKTSAVLIVSVSGDGGYNEVINGALRAAEENNTAPVCAVMPGGNANDHHSNVARRPLMDAIRSGNVEELDLLRVTYDGTTRYAHSYVGLGLTPLVAKELNEHTLNAMKETWLALKTYWKLRPFEIESGGRRYKFDSLLMTTVGTMAKYLTLSKNSTPTDGKFDLIKWPHNNKLRLTWLVLKALAGRHKAAERVKRFDFTILKPQPMQLDGELVNIPSGTKVSVSIQPKKLRTVL